MIGDDRYGNLVTGGESFVADLPEDALHLHFVRSPIASARITAIDIDAARAVEGVVTVFTAADLAILPVWEIAMIPEEFAQPPLAHDLVRYVGERVAAVIATSPAEAADASDLVIVEYDPLPPLTDVRDHGRAGAPVLFTHHPGNVCLEWASDAPGATNDSAGVVATVEHWIPRLSVAPLEGHAVLAVPGDDGRLTVFVSTQVPTATQRQIARSLGMALADVRVVVPAVGGGFGGKAAGGVCDHVVTAAAARVLGRPVRFVEGRNVNITSMQGRGVRSRVTLRASEHGELVGIAADIVADAGAYPTVGAVEPGKTRLMACGPYRFEVADISARAVVTNLPPVGAYRGPGRSEAAVMIERTLDVLAADLGIDPVDIRRRNVIASDAFPYTTPTGVVYDSGDYLALLGRLERESGYLALRAEQRLRRERGDPLLGIGVSLIVDSTAWFARTEGAAVGVDRSGSVLVLAGSSSAGHQHAALYRQVVRRRLPVAEEQIRVVEGDTDAWGQSDGTMGSRTAQLAGTAVLHATELVVSALRELAANALETSADDITYHEGAGFGVRGVPASALPLAALVARAEEPVEARCVHEQEDASYPSAAHLSVVEVDVETGRVVPVRHIAVTDCGTVLDLPSARGQVIGATVQGIAQALYEESVFDADGNPLVTSFAEYGIPSAAEIPPVETHFLCTPSPRNPLGAKGVGEIGMIAAPVAVQNAVVDAVRHLGIRHIDMPCSAEKVWRSIRLGARG
jgi:aerobic carbon-monoxide dehydrogenase large subunit